MLISELFETRVADKIEPVIKVNETADEQKLAIEVGSYVVTPTIEKYLAGFLDHYTDTFQLDTTEIGVWISGYFGSGKSHLAKMMGLLAENRRLAGATACQRFEARLPPGTPEGNNIRRALARMPQCDTRLLAFNINTLADSKATPLPKLLLSQFYQSKGYGSNLLYARVIESELDRQGRLPDLHRAVEESSGRAWADIQKNPTFFQRHLYSAASALASDSFPTTAAVGDALQKAQAGEIYNVGFLVDTLLADLADRERASRRKQRLLLVLDESGQWIEGDKDRLAQLQSLIEESAVKGQGRIWVVVTTHGDMGSVLKEAKALEGDMKKIEGRFRYKFSLTTENIELVLEDRLFKKSLPGREELDTIYRRRGGVLRDIGELRGERVLPSCTAEKFGTYYPFFPYQVSLIPEIVKSLRSRGGRGEQLSGSTRTLLAIAQDILRAGRRPYLGEAVGPLVSFDEVYGNLAGEGEVSPDVRDDIGRITRTVKDATPLTQQVAEVLYLVRELPFLVRSKDNLARLLATDVDDDLSALVQRIEPELERLRRAKLVGITGDEYEFLTGEKRTFEDEVATLESQLRAQDKERGLADHFFHQAGRPWWKDWLDFDRIAHTGFEFDFRLSLDGVAMPGRTGDVTVRVTTPFGRENLPSIEDRSLRADEQNSVFVYSGPVPKFDEHLSRYLAMREVIGAWIGDTHRSEEAKRLAREREKDLETVRKRVLTDLREGLARGFVVFRGGSRQVSVPASRGVTDVLRAEIAAFWPVIYPKLERLPVRVANEESAIRDVLGGGTTHRDAVALKLFDRAGKLDPSAVVTDAIRVFLSAQQSRSRRVLGADLLAEFTAPPYGWDGNALRVGVAALVRSGAVKLVVNKKPFTNPADPELVDAIRISRAFEKAELVLEDSEPDPDELAAVRALLRRVAKRRDIDETPAALSDAAGLVADDMAAKADRVRVWASPANFPLPAAFDEAVDGWAKVASLKNPVHRVHEVFLGAEKLELGYGQVNEIVTFQAGEGQLFVEMGRLVRDLVAIEHRLEDGSPVRTFLNAYEHARRARTVADGEAWRHLRSLEATARLELSVALEKWRDQAREIARRAEADVEQLATRLNVPTEAVPAIKVPLASFLTELDQAAGPVRVSAQVDVARQLAERLTVAVGEEAARRRRLDPIPRAAPRGETTVTSVPIDTPRPTPVSHLESVHIEAFRGLRGARIGGLSRVNLIVSRNNGGKTSVLEAACLCCLPLNAAAWVDVARRRGLGDPGQPVNESFAWLFPHDAGAKAVGEISLRFQRKGSSSRHLHATLGDDGREVLVTLVEAGPTETISKVAFDPAQPPESLPTGRTNEDVPVVFVTPITHRFELFQILALSELADQDTRARVVRLLQQLDPQIVGVEADPAAVPPTLVVSHQTRGRAPISTFGDGLRRTLALALALMRCRGGGALLVDEIESGIHHAALREAYRWLVKAAHKYDVQLFVTTHSLEAIDALLEATQPADDTSFYRLDAAGGLVKVVRFDEDELRALRAEFGDEVRG